MHTSTYAILILFVHCFLQQYRPSRPHPDADSTHFGLPFKYLHKLQLIQNSYHQQIISPGVIPQIISVLFLSSIIVSVLNTVSLLTFMALSNRMLSYLKELPHVYTPSHSLLCHSFYYTICPPWRLKHSVIMPSTSDTHLNMDFKILSQKAAFKLAIWSDDDSNGGAVCF